ncbi:MAG: transcriptional regulator [Methanobacteriaceae archaeon]
MITQNRLQLIQQISQILLNQGFETSNIYERSCFDMAARKKLLLLLLKVFVNIDSINKENVQEIKKVAHTFLASPVIVGLKSKDEKLEEDVVYERQGLPVIGVETLTNMILYGEYPEIIADRGGYYVKVNGPLLKEYRDEYNLSLKDLADLAHVSRETIYKYENGLVKSNPETAIILEEILNMKITLDINILKVPKIDDTINTPNTVNIEQSTETLTNLGYGVISTKKTPFDALTKLNINNPIPQIPKNQDNTAVITNLEQNRNEKKLKTMAVSLKDISLITGSESAFIIDNKKFKDSLDGIPIINSWEIKEMTEASEFLKLIRERKDN